MSDDTVTITLPLSQVGKMIHLYGWACSQSEGTPEQQQPWWDIYHEMQRQVSEQTHVQ